MIDAAKKKSISPPGLTALWTILLLVVALFLPETRVWGFEITPQPASGVFAPANPLSIGENYDGCPYDVSDSLLAAKGVAPGIKAGAAGGETAGKTFPQAIKDAANAENPLKVCVFCRREGVATQVDHAIPRARGGNATLDNAQLACPHCNASKGARDFPVNPPPDYFGKWPP